jgi:hypothetical protein
MAPSMQPPMATRAWHTFISPRRGPSNPYPPNARIKSRQTSLSFTVYLPSQLTNAFISTEYPPEESEPRLIDICIDGEIIKTLKLPSHVTDQYVLLRRKECLEVIWYEKKFWEESGGLYSCQKGLYEWGSDLEEIDEFYAAVSKEELTRVDKKKMVPEIVKLRKKGKGKLDASGEKGMGKALKAAQRNGTAIERTGLVVTHPRIEKR